MAKSRHERAETCYQGVLGHEISRTKGTFLSNKTKENTRIAIKENERIVTNQTVVADVLCNHFSTAAINTGGAHANNLTELDFADHPSIEQTCSKHGKYHICYHIYTSVNMVANVVFTMFATGLRWVNTFATYLRCANLM